MPILCVMPNFILPFGMVSDVIDLSIFAGLNDHCHHVIGSDPKGQVFPDTRNIRQVDVYT